MGQDELELGREANVEITASVFNSIALNSPNAARRRKRVKGEIGGLKFMSTIEKTSVFDGGGVRGGIGAEYRWSGSIRG